MNIKTQRGFIGLGALMVIVLAVIVVGGGAYYIGHKNTVATPPTSTADISSQPKTNTRAPATIEPATTAGTNQTNWKTYRNDVRGFTIQYPVGDDIEIDDASDNGFQVFFASKTGPTIQIDGETGSGYCYKGLCDTVAKSQLTYNGTTWDSIGSSQYCDAGTCFNSNDVYRTKFNGSTYYITFDDKTQARNVLKTFKFTSSSSSATPITVDSSVSTCSTQPSIYGSALNTNTIRVEMLLNSTAVQTADVSVVGGKWSYVPNPALVAGSTYFIHAFVPASANSSGTTGPESMLNVLSPQYCH